MDDVKRVVDSLLDDGKPLDEETLEMASEIRNVLNAMLDAYISDDEYEDNLRNLLEEDEYLTQELLDKIGFMNIVEGAPRGTFSKEEIENIYLAVIDSFFELSKIISPLNGFGKDRIMAGLDLIREYEKKYWPRATRIVPENAPAFSDLIPAEHYEDILTGKKRALGALRCIGDRVYAAGAIVYSVYDDADETPMIDINWIETHESLRARGIANFLMALVIELSYFSDEENPFDLMVDIPIRKADTVEALEKISEVENFFDSWKFDFSLAYESTFFISFSDLKEANIFPKNVRKIDDDLKSLRELGPDGKSMLKEFFEGLGAESYKKVSTMSYDFFDPDISYVSVLKGKISSAILFHRFADDNYRLEAFYYADKRHIYDLTRFLPLIYQAMDKKGVDCIITGTFETEEGYEMATKMLPCLYVSMVYRGALDAPKDYITSDEWGQLREKAGFSNDLIPEEGLTDEDISKEDEQLIKQFTADNGFKEY